MYLVGWQRCFLEHGSGVFAIGRKCSAMTLAGRLSFCIAIVLLAGILGPRIFFEAAKGFGMVVEMLSGTWQ